MITKDNFMEILLKTFKESDYSFAKNLLDSGDLFFQHVSVYQEIEDGEVRGDLNEGQVVEEYELPVTPNMKKILIGNSDGGKQYVLDLEKVRENIPNLRGAGQSKIRINYTVDMLLYCMTYINNKTCNIQYILNNLSRLGKYCVVITDCKGFISKVNSQIKGKCGLVEYCDMKKSSIFVKKKFYSWQSEYRIGIAANGLKQKLISIGPLNGFIFDTSDTSFIEQFLKKYK